MLDSKKNDGKANSPESKAAMEAFKKDIRGAHFNFGNDSTEYVSEANSGMIAHEVVKHNFDLKAKTSEMRSANFTFDNKGPGKMGGSCYSAMISDVADAPGFMNGRAQSLRQGK